MVAPFSLGLATILAVMLSSVCFSSKQCLATELQRVSDEVDNLYRFEDTCNVYVLKSNDRALLIDLGSGDVLEHLTQIGVSQVDWVLFTHHHREQCQESIICDATVLKSRCRRPNETCSKSR